MLKRHVDRFGRHDIRVGDSLKMPLSLHGPFSPVDPPYRHGTFDVVAFPAIGDGPRPFPGQRQMAHCLTIRRRADGFTTTIAAWHWLRIREAYGGC